MFSLLHGTVAPQEGQFVSFPDNRELSKDSLSPNEIGEGNFVLHFAQTTSVSGIYLPPIIIKSILKSDNHYLYFTYFIDPDSTCTF